MCGGIEKLDLCDGKETLPKTLGKFGIYISSAKQKKFLIK
jgi:hypothetical protein